MRSHHSATDIESAGDFLPMALPAPDPAKPAYLHRFGNHGTFAGKRWDLHYDRRSRILAAARSLLLKSGYDGVSFRSIADICEISVPTIYNVVGDRARVMNDSSVEWVQWLALAAARDKADSTVLATLAAFWNTPIDFPEYTTNATYAACSPDSPLNRAFEATGGAILFELLAKLHAEGLLKSFVDVESLSRRLANCVHFEVCSWVMAPHSADRFRRDFVYGPGMMLMGAVRGPEAEKVERGIAAILAR